MTESSNTPDPRLVIQSEIIEARQRREVYRERGAVEHYAFLLGALGLLISLPLALADLWIDWRLPFATGLAAAWGFRARRKARAKAAELNAVVDERRAALFDPGAT